MAAFLAHPEWVDASARITASELADRRRTLDRLQVVDVRDPGERVSGGVPGAIAMPLAQILDRVGELDPTAPTVVYCAGGYRSMIGASPMLPPLA